jgi:hypothetical protein
VKVQRENIGKSFLAMVSERFSKYVTGRKAKIDK